ncbi:MAG: antibiotic biosynthesis monooxygenase [Desulfobulbus sp.]|nr:antibiotic biosynthesis monooxygenase [Desulfobulbus sp.]
MQQAESRLRKTITLFLYYSLPMDFSQFSRTPPPPYYAVIFTSRLSSNNDDGYKEMADKMVRLASLQSGFLGCESVRGQDGFGITVSYWASKEAIAHWKDNVEHLAAQAMGKRSWYEQYELRIAKVECAHGKSA